MEELVSEPVWEAALRTAASLRPGASRTTGLPASRSARAAVDERPAVDDVLGVDRDGPRPLVVDARTHEVDDPEVRLVADGDEPGHAQAAVGHEAREVEGQVAALAEHGHVADREEGRRQLEAGRGVDDAEAVGADDHGAGPASDRQALGLQPGSLGAGLGEAGRDRHDRAGAGGDGVGHRCHESTGRHAEHRQVDAQVVRGGGGHRRGDGSARRAPRRRAG